MNIPSIELLRGLTPKVVFLGSHPGIIQSILDFDYLNGNGRPSVVAIIANTRKLERYFWGEDEVTIPVYPSLGSLPKSQVGLVNFVVNVQSARHSLTGTRLAIDTLPNLKSVVIFAEQTPERHSLDLAQYARSRGILVIGPASVGLLLPGQLKLGAIGGTQHPQIVSAKILQSGDCAVISTSGGMVNELIHIVASSGRRVSFAMALGGDRFPVTSPAEAFLMAEQDPKTKQIVYFGELGGDDEYQIADLIKTQKVKKPVLAYVAGVVSELFETPPQFGHAKAMAKTQSETASAKKEVLRSVGVNVLDSLSKMSESLTKGVRVVDDTMPARSIGQRSAKLIVSHISGDVDGDVQLLGKDLLKTIESNSLAGLTLSMLLGHSVNSKKLIDFTDYVLRVSVDHGPYVSGAINTIVAARAGKDLVSSLASGLLTIGPRFGGAINQAAGNWLSGVEQSIKAKDFVNSFKDNGGIIPGIGHKKYRIDLPDPRVAALRNFAPKGARYLSFALEVQSITVNKKGNLILNVDGAIAALMLDLLSSDLAYDSVRLRELVDIEFFNALFILSRSIGFTAHYLDQRRHDEGLLRLGPKEIGYNPLA